MRLKVQFRTCCEFVEKVILFSDEVEYTNANLCAAIFHQTGLTPKEITNVERIDD